MSQRVEEKTWGWNPSLHVLSVPVSVQPAVTSVMTCHSYQSFQTHASQHFCLHGVGYTHKYPSDQHHLVYCLAILDVQ